MKEIHQADLAGGARRTDHARCTFCGYEFRSADQVEIDHVRDRDVL